MVQSFVKGWNGETVDLKGGTMGSGNDASTQAKLKCQNPGWCGSWFKVSTQPAEEQKCFRGELTTPWKNYREPLSEDYRDTKKVL